MCLSEQEIGWCPCVPIMCMMWLFAVTQQEMWLLLAWGSNNIHKVLKPFSVVDVRGPQVFQAVRRAKDVAIVDLWLADCHSAPQMHLGVSRMPQRYRHVPKRPTPVLSLLSAIHRLRGISEPDGRQRVGVTKNWAGAVALSHATLHDSRMLKLELISAAAWRRKGRRECRCCVPRNSALWTWVWRRWLVFSYA